MGMFGVFKASLNEMEHPFENKKRVTLKIKEFELKGGDYPKALFNCEVVDGEKAGMEYVFILSLKDGQYQKKVRLGFLRCFFTDAEIFGDTYQGKAVIGKSFSAVPSNLEAKAGELDNNGNPRSGITLWDLFAKVDQTVSGNKDDLPF